MKDYFWTTFFLLAVLQSAFAFKIPGLSGGGSGRSPSGGTKPAVPAGGGGPGNAHKDAGEYMGPVFIIRELDKEKGEYDAFITTGGIQEVKPHLHPQPQHQQQQHQQQQPQPQQQQQQQPHPYIPQQLQQPPPQQQHQQMVYQMNPAASAPLPDVAKEEAEDSEYFGVLITPDTVRTLNFPKSTNINVSLSVLLVAASSRMPWLLVLHRKNYPSFEYQQQPPPQPQPQPQQLVPGIIPGMQIPQRRRHYAPPLDRQRRGLQSRPDDATRWTKGPKWETEDAVEYRIADDDTKTHVMPLMSERQLMSTMCYNFERENADMKQPLANEFYFDANAYAAAADSMASATPKDWEFPKVIVSTVTTRPTSAEAEKTETEEINRTKPKHYSPQEPMERYTIEELNRMFHKRDDATGQEEDVTYLTVDEAEKIYRMNPNRQTAYALQEAYINEALNQMTIKRGEGRRRPSGNAIIEEVKKQLAIYLGIHTTDKPMKAEKETEEMNPKNPENGSPQTTKDINKEVEPDQMSMRVEPHETTRPLTSEETMQLNWMNSRRTESQSTTKPLTVEEAQAADKVFTGHSS